MLRLPSFLIYLSGGVFRSVASVVILLPAMTYFFDVEALGVFSIGILIAHLTESVTTFGSIAAYDHFQSKSYKRQVKSANGAAQDVQLIDLLRFDEISRLLILLCGLPVLASLYFLELLDGVAISVFFLALLNSVFAARVVFSQKQLNRHDRPYMLLFLTILRALLNAAFIVAFGYSSFTDAYWLGVAVLLATMIIWWFTTFIHEMSFVRTARTRPHNLRRIFGYVMPSYIRVGIEVTANSLDRIVLVAFAPLSLVAAYQQSIQFRTAITLVRRSAAQSLYQSQIDEKVDEVGRRSFLLLIFGCGAAFFGTVFNENFGALLFMLITNGKFPELKWLVSGWLLYLPITFMGMVAMQEAFLKGHLKDISTITAFVAVFSALSTLVVAYSGHFLWLPFVLAGWRGIEQGAILVIATRLRLRTMHWNTVICCVTGVSQIAVMMWMNQS